MSITLTNISAYSLPIDDIADLIDVGGAGTLQIYTASMATLLAELTFSNPAFLPSSGGIALSNPIVYETSAYDTGFMDMFRIIDGNGDPVLSGSITVTGSGGDLEVSDLVLYIGDELQISQLSLSLS